MMLKTYCVIFPCDPLNTREVDPDYQVEWQAAQPYFDTALIDLDTLIQDGKCQFKFLPAELNRVLYRGWMLRPDQYLLLEQGIQACGGQLVTSTEAYLATHLLPHWAGHANTLPANWTEDLSDQSLIALLDQFSGPVTVKDFVKSRKNEWGSAFFIPDASDHEHALSVIHNFIKRQGDLLVGGVVLREFVSFAPVGHFHDEPIYDEYRVFYWQGTPFVIHPYWTGQQNTLADSDRQFIADQAEGIQSPFYTIDFARLADGHLTIMEIGDGQVSGLQGIDALVFYQGLRQQIMS